LRRSRTGLFMSKTRVSSSSVECRASDNANESQNAP
jgi:hypothetical protein